MNKEQVKKAILSGRIWARVESVSKSGMSRRISFFVVGDEKLEFAGNYYAIQNVTPEIAWLTGWVKEGEYFQGGKHLKDAGLRVSGCGMDMIFHTLYVAVGSEKWNQRYNTI